MKTLRTPFVRFKPFYVGCVCLLMLGACGGRGPAPRPYLADRTTIGLSTFEAPACGARIFVVMGLNQKYPTRENMRIPEGDLYLDGIRVDKVSSHPEISVFDVPAGKVELSWVPSSYDDAVRSHTAQNTLLLNLADQQTVLLTLEWYDDTPVTTGLSLSSAGFAFRTEVVRAQTKDAFAGKHVAFHAPLRTPCAQTMVAGTALPHLPQQQAALPPKPEPQPKPERPQAAPPATPVPAPQVPRAQPPEVSPPAAVLPSPVPQKTVPPAQPAALPSTPAPPLPSVPEPARAPQETQQAALPPATIPAPSQPEPLQPETAASEAFFATAQFYYVVSAPKGAPAYPAPNADEPPLYTFADSTELNVLDVSADKRWLKVVVPDKRVAYVSTALVTSGIKAPPEAAKKAKR